MPVVSRSKYMSFILSVDSWNLFGGMAVRAVDPVVQNSNDENSILFQSFQNDDEMLCNYQKLRFIIHNSNNASRYLQRF